MRNAKKRPVIGRPKVENKKRMFGMALRPEVIERLKAEANKLDRSYSSLAQELLIQGLERLELGVD